MILDDIFEALKPSDMPTYLRRQQGRPDLTMRDVEKERPDSVYQYQVGNTLFMSYGAAAEYARGTHQQVQKVRSEPEGNQPQYTHRVVDARPGRPGALFRSQAEAEKYAATVNGRVEPISEQVLSEQEIDIPATMNPANRGALILTALQKDKEFAKMSRRPLRFNMAGEQFLVYDPDVKNGILGMALAHKKRGSLDQFLLNLGQPESLRLLLAQFEGDHAHATPGQAGGQRASRYARESQDLKKKTDVAEQGAAGDNARTQRMVANLRARHPQARSDLEALIYDVDQKRARDQQDLDKLEKEIDDVQGDVKKDLEQTIKQLRGRKGLSGELVKQVQGTDRAQSDAIKRIMAVNQDQQKAIDDLEATLKTPAQDQSMPSAPLAFPDQPRSSTQPTAVAPAPAQPAKAAKPRTTTKSKSTTIKAKSSSAKAKGATTKKPTAKPTGLPLEVPADQTPEPASAPASTPTATAATQPAPIPTAQILKFPKGRRQAELPLDGEEPFEPMARTGSDRLREHANPGLWQQALNKSQEKFSSQMISEQIDWASKWYRAHGGTWKKN